MTEHRDEQLILRDGRRLGISEFGDPAGQPVIFCHGFPASRLDGWLAHEAAMRLKVRLVVPDRPGYGLSDFQPGRRIGDWPHDVLEIADALALSHFAVLGISGGGPFAVACAAALPDRVSAVGIVCGLGRLDIRDDASLMNPFARASFMLARRLPALSQLFNRALAPLLRESPRWMLKLLAYDLPPPDQVALADPKVFAFFADSLREALRQGGRGAALELTLYAQPWKFAPESIRVPCYLWHGRQDTTVPVAMGKRLAAAIPGCRAEFLPDEGHFSLPVRRMDQILRTLAAHG